MAPTPPKKIYRFRYAKLVRDNMPTIIEKEGWLVKKRILPAVSFQKELLKKLAEEVVELREAKSRDERLSEISDLLEIIEAYAESAGLSGIELRRHKALKQRKNGAYQDKTYIDHVTYRDGADRKWLDYHLKNRKQFPLIK